MNGICKVLSLSFLFAALAFGQVTTTSTTLSATVGQSDLFVNVASATGITAAGTLNQTNTILFVDGEAMQVTTVSGTYIGVQRDTTRTTPHASGSLVWVGPPNYFFIQDPVPNSACTASQNTNLPRPSLQSGKVWDCVGGQWGAQAYSSFYVAPTNCTFAPTTSTVTNTYPQVGASTLFVLNGTTNAAAGTTTLVCNIYVPSHVAALKGAYLQDITLFIGSQTTAPTSLGTSTLGSITFPAAATTEVASTVTPVAAGGAVTTTSPTLITTVTTAGSFLTIKHTYASAVRLSTDLQLFQYTMPFLQSAAAVMTLNTPGLLIHYREPLQ
jgi:hypothetical protein